jgi:hypothetical protein
MSYFWKAKYLMVLFFFLFLEREDLTGKLNVASRRSTEFSKLILYFNCCGIFLHILLVFDDLFNGSG